MEERRLDRVLDLAVEAGGSSSSDDPATGEAVLELTVDLRNAGPRDVVVERGTSGGFALVQDVVEVRTGGQAPLLLRRASTRAPGRDPGRWSCRWNRG